MDVDKIIAICIATCICVGTVSCTTYNVIDNNNDTATEMTRKKLYADTLIAANNAGKDPLQIGCAWGVYNNAGDTTICTLNQARK